MNGCFAGSGADRPLPRLLRPKTVSVRQWRHCGKKRAMEEAEAQQEALRLQKKEPRAAAYPCKYGLHWHVGRQKDR
jgi:hypothetical protein